MQQTTGAPSEAKRARLTRIGLILVAGTMLYNVVEAGVALWAALAAGSVALRLLKYDPVEHPRWHGPQ